MPLLRPCWEPFAAADHVPVALSRRRVSIIEMSEPLPGCGSVITKAERTLPATMGAIQHSFSRPASPPSPAPSCCRC